MRLVATTIWNDIFSTKTSKMILPPKYQNALIPIPNLGRARAVEDELIVRYAANQLSSIRRAAFEQYFLSSPEKRQRLQFVQLMMRTLNQPNVAGLSLQNRSCAYFLARHKLIFWMSGTRS